uniref:Secreted protein n=1 Tax=Anopheles darlingi TaxID=43151 RepID=A0A2M4DA38_ANODA
MFVLCFAWSTILTPVCSCCIFHLHRISISLRCPVCLCLCACEGYYLCSNLLYLSLFVFLLFAKSTHPEREGETPWIGRCARCAA